MNIKIDKESVRRHLMEFSISEYLGFTDEEVSEVFERELPAISHPEE